MRLRIVVDQTYWQTPDGQVWTRMPPAYPFFEAHLRHFSEVEVVARTQPVAEPPVQARLASGQGVRWRPVPRYAGLAAFVRKSPRVIAALGGPNADAALLLRGPSHLANLEYWRRPKGTYGVEVLGDPEMLYGRDPLHRAWFTANLRRQCRSAIAAAYVSQALENRYPSPNPHRLLDIDLPPEAFALTPRRECVQGSLHVVSVGGFDHPVKGHDVLIRAMARLPNARLTIVGGGALRRSLEALAEECRVAVRFEGQLGGPAAVREVLRGADVFVLASRSEGMPRALIEAMALGVPAVATAVGGIPEILPAEQLVPPEDTLALALAIAATAADSTRYARISRQGIAIARHYSAEKQRQNRGRFLQELREAADLHREGRRVYAC